MTRICDIQCCACHTSPFDFHVCCVFNDATIVVMKFLRSNSSSEQRPREQHCMHHSNLARKWRSLSARTRRRIVLFIAFLVFILLLGYNLITSDIYLHQMSPLVSIHRRDRSRCCSTSTSSSDICGRPNCVWPCPSPPVEEYQHINAMQDNAFFHETSGASSLSFRQACVVESLAYRNPNLTVHLLMTARHLDLNALTIKTLSQNYPNLRLTSINLGDYVAGTPLERWYFCTEWYRGWFAVSHLSDALRFLTLSKYGGYYFDLDIIHLRPVTAYRNFIVPEDMTKLGSSVIHVDYQHQVIRMAVEEFAADYRWYSWAHNGPELITRVLQNWCNVYYISWMTLERCKGFHILPPTSFYPVHYKKWKEYFTNRDNNNKAEEKSYEWDEFVLGAHVWNSLSAGWKVHKNSNQLYVDIARSSCPRIFDVAPEEF
ncbi:hypothetical protein GHT06_022884 [Daphnia sinensis]|uniref:Alpha 1,4-glycosyltransferase domain-containing protein n=1 Tax=Daphnia sinensis TaxID=1820382 RepID=A0AAD5KYT3_9CRUS|nr:hypothetical protein GHT06_022884 [Daphnia sinensis]